MTRKEEIEEMATKIATKICSIYESNKLVKKETVVDPDMYDAAIEAAEWADSNPADSIIDEFIKDEGYIPQERLFEIQQVLKLAEKALCKALGSKEKSIFMPAAKVLKEIQKLK